MTISEQIREAALYEVDPYNAMTNKAFEKCLSFKGLWNDLDDMPVTKLRTFMLLVAEALE